MRKLIPLFTILKSISILIIFNFLLTLLSVALLAWIEDGEHPMTFESFDQSSTEMLIFEFAVEAFPILSSLIFPYTTIFLGLISLILLLRNHRKNKNL
ncbi:hypothetical protein CLV96_4009 [Leptospira meyeri]|uniref:Uncharacterized protein n=1 Tax=Leptospira meyeri TaxID=29508 RepID=A0A4R8MJD5_LEPME|nr:hypothetical protein [Leptospira meyeri]TDY66041.1 hypothetical protein CLV96_4009 [Leptospira meyeri]